MSDNNNQVNEEKISDDELDEIIQDISQEAPKAEVVQTQAAPKVVPMNTKNKSAQKNTEQCLSLELTGSINLKLCFSSGERSIEVFCTEEALICRMADGTEFRIPTGMNKKAAA